jgi:glycerol-3-phosphate acyltransferase PlsY
MVGPRPPARGRNRGIAFPRNPLPPGPAVTYPRGMHSLAESGMAAALGYAAGCIPFAWILVKVRTGTDLRTVGSGNVGATNAARVLGKRWFALVFLLDAAKGAVPVVVAPWLWPAGGGEDGRFAPWVPVAAAAGAVLGHVFPAPLGFRGGKAVATGAGAVGALHPVALLAGVAAFGATAWATRYVSVGSVAAAAATVAAFHLVPSALEPRQVMPVGAFVHLLAGVVLVKHVGNLRRVLAGTEPRIGASPPAAPAPPGGSP